MLDGLDQVNWRALRHSYGLATDVPEKLRLMVEASDEEAQNEAFGELTNTINHQGDIYSATAATVPFLMQLVNRRLFPRRDWVLYALVGLLESCNGHISYRKEISQLKDEFATLVSIEQSLPAYLALLKDTDHTVRALAARILMLVRNQRPAVRLPLWRASEGEQNVFARAWMIQGVSKLITHNHYPSAKHVRQHYRARFFSLIAPQEKLVIRLAAAVAWIDCEPYIALKPVPTLIPHTLTDGLVNPRIPETKEDIFPLLDGLLEQDTIIECLRRLGINGLSEALHTEGLTAEVAHTLIRELLEIGFTRIGPHHRHISGDTFDAWSPYEGDHRTKNRAEILYAYPSGFGTASSYLVNGRLNQRQLEIIEGIVACEQFWQMPTNLFSFFYGLPDTRDELQWLSRT